MKRSHRLFEVGGYYSVLAKGKRKKMIRQRTSKPAIYSQL